MVAEEGLDIDERNDDVYPRDQCRGRRLLQSRFLRLCGQSLVLRGSGSHNCEDVKRVAPRCSPCLPWGLLNIALCYYTALPIETKMYRNICTCKDVVFEQLVHVGGVR